MLNPQNTLAILDNMTDLAKKQTRLYKPMFLPLTQHFQFPKNVTIVCKIVDDTFVYKVLDNGKPEVILVASTVADLLESIKVAREKIANETPKFVQGSLI